ncbi:MAG: ABC transporter permease, partial [Muribaculum sp.]|nr:ABC transporter permease [Muribaculum sp.]
PLFYPLVYSIIYNPELVRDVTVVVVDHDRTARSRQLARMLDATQEARIIGYAADLDEARRAMDSHECYGILEIPEGFQKSIGRQETAHAVIYTEMSLLLRYRSLLMAATNVSQAIGAEIQSEDIDAVLPIASTVMPGDPMPVEAVQLGNITGGFDSFIMPGVLILILQQSIILAVGLAGGNRRERRLLGQSSLPGSVTATLAGRALCYIVMAILPAIYILHYVPMMFSFPMEGSPLQIFAFVLPMIIASIMLGFTLQTFISERESIFVVWVVTSVIFLFLSGLTWPRFAMAAPWKALSDCVPATFGVMGYVRMNANGADLSQLHMEYTGLWIQAAVYTMLAWVAQWYVRRKYAK